MVSASPQDKYFTFLKVTTYLILGFCLLSTLSSCRNRSSEPLPTAASLSTNKPLDDFDAEITSTVQELKVTPGAPFEIPVTIKNCTQETWSSTGKYPVVVSYKWFDNGLILPIEGDRTALPTPLPPMRSVTVTVKGGVPSSGQNLVVRISLVQEGVAWFMMKGAPSLPIPAKMRLVPTN